MVAALRPLQNRSHQWEICAEDRVQQTLLADICG